MEGKIASYQMTVKILMVSTRRAGHVSALMQQECSSAAEFISVEKGFRTTAALNLRGWVVQRPLNHWGKPSGGVWDRLFAAEFISVEPGFCTTTALNLRGWVVQRPLNHRGKPGGGGCARWGGHDGRYALRYGSFGRAPLPPLVPTLRASLPPA